MRNDNGAADGGFLCRARASVACAAIDERAPDALDLDRPLKLEDMVLARWGGCRLRAGFARRDPAFGYGIVPSAETDHVRFSSFQIPQLSGRLSLAPVACVLGEIAVRRLLANILLLVVAVALGGVDRDRRRAAGALVALVFFRNRLHCLRQRPCHQL
ncbi:blr4100 [Bradyrhizobium diazoefficiens USDA 110]|uniref:Blr4100 protein n=1 Tax=Bradyrhizobium diazoefficiens (strain JCM 10833 / BCRC 13528 / IAM 13628 / NBRC 14792 / USDA 110) TaxID=224911 RepID=Q89MU2_BRADU|nr:hypothetical protein CO678_14315 [Bradyrhizobium diazoefficiens]QBP22867.1 hypothetical protein Bdiaspc4_21220 [Bradyrhizobium diazoefficiens]BAC49365.1 blr4100 [Bradyrhizobium diazoefficiens USDA 110]